MSTKDYTFSVVLLQHGDWWSAQCLEYDIATQAKTLPDLLYELQRTIIGHFVVAEEEGIMPFEGLGPAPQKYWDMFEGAHVKVARDRVPFRIPAKVARRIPRPRIRVAELAALA